MANLGKSLYFSTKSAFRNEMPVITGTYEKNKEEFKTGTDYIKKFVTKKGAISTHGVNTAVSHFLKDLDELRKNAFDDLRTGKINNMQRDMDALEKQYGFGGDGDGGFDFNFDNEDASDATFEIKEDNDSISLRASAIAEAGGTIRTKAVMETLIDTSERSANYITNNSRKLTSMHMSLSSQMHTETIKTMHDTNSLLTGMINFQNNQMVEHMNKTLVFYDSVLEELRGIKTAVAPKQEDHNSRKSNGFEDILGSGGLDMKAYGGAIKKNFGNWFNGTTLGMAASFAKLAGGDGGIMGAIKGNPLGFISDLIVSGLMPKSMKMAMGSLDKSMSGLFSTLILGFNKMKGDFSSPFKQFLGSVFGVDIGGKRNIDTSRFHKGVMQYNGRADKALTEVIPTLLSHILSAVKGSDKVSLYNYTTGKFTDGAGMMSEHKQRVRQSTAYEMHDTRTAMKNRLANVQGGSSAFMTDELDTFLDHLVTRGKHYNPYKHTTAADLDGLNMRDPRSYNLIRTAFMSMPKNMQNRIAHEIIKGRMGSSRTVDTIENELKDSGMGAAYSGLEPPKLKGGTGVGVTNGLLKDIKNILTDGIKVIQIGTMPGNPNLIRNIMGRRQDTKDYGGGGSGGSGGGPPSPPTPNPVPEGKDKLEATHRLTEEELKQKMSQGVDAGSSHTGFRKFIEEISKQRTLKDKYKVFRQGMNPKNIITKGMSKVDSFLHTVIFGQGGKQSGDGGADGDGDGPDGDGSGPGKNGFFSRMTQRMSLAIDKSLKWVESKVLTPLHEKFFGAQGIFTKFQEKMNPFLDKMKAFAKGKWDKLKETFMGTLNQDGFYTGGIFADVGNSFKDYSNQMRHLFTGSTYKKSNGDVVTENKKSSVFAYVKTYSKNIMESIKTGLFGAKEEHDVIDPETGEVKKVTKRKGDGLLSGVMDQLNKAFKTFDSLFKTKEGESEGDVQGAIGKWKKEFKGFLPKGLAGGALGMVGSALLPGGPLVWGMLGATAAFAGHSKKFREFLFGNDDEGRPGIIPPHYKKILTNIKASLPSILGAGVIGLGAGMLLPGISPLVGLTLGSAVGYAAKSKGVQEWLFGNGDDKKGVLGADFKNKLKKFIPAMGAGALLGLAGSALLPGGPLIAMTLGAGIGFASKSAKVSETLFGKTDNQGNIITKGMFSPDMKDKIKKNLPKGVGGALFGMMTGVLTGNPIIGAMMGASMSILTSSDKFKSFLFGKEDEDTHKKRGGLLGSVRDFVADEFLVPFKHWVGKKGIIIKDWFENSIKTPFIHVMTPLKDAFGIIGKNIKESWGELKDSFKKAFVDTFNNNIGIPLKEFVTKNITDPLKNMFNKFFNVIGKGLGAILTAPAKGLALFANSIIEADKKKDDKQFKKLGLGPTKYDPYDIDAGMNLDPKNSLDQDYKEMIMDGRKKKLKEKLAAYNKKHGLIDLDPNDPLDMQFKEAMRNRKTETRVVDTPFDKHFDSEMAKHREAQQKVHNDIVQPLINQQSNLVHPNDIKSKHRLPLDLQMFASGDPNKLKLDFGARGKGAGGDILTQIKGILISYGKKFKDIDDSTKSIDTQLKDGIHVKEKEHKHGEDKRGLTLVGAFDYDKFNAHNATMLGYVKDIRNEVSGQLDGVGYNIETMTNILMKTYGHPGVDAKGLRGMRGNRVKRGIFGKMLNLLTNPINFMKNMTKVLIMKPITMMMGGIKKIFGTIPSILGSGIKLFGRSVNKLISLPFKAISGVARAIGGIGKGMIKFFKSDFFKSIGKFASTLIDGILVKPLKGLFTVVGQVTKGLWTIAKGIGGLAKDAMMGMLGLAKDAIPYLGKGIRAVGTGMFELGKGMLKLTATVGKAIWGMAKFAAGMVGSAFRGIGRMIGIGSKTRDIMGSTGMSGKPVYVVGGTIDKVNTIKEVETIKEIQLVKEVDKVKTVDVLTKIEEIVKVIITKAEKTGGGHAAGSHSMGLGLGSRNNSNKPFTPRLKLDLQHFASNPKGSEHMPSPEHMEATAEGGEEHKSSKGAGKARTFKTRSIFAKAGSFLSRMGSGKWNDSVPRIMGIQNLAKGVKSEEDYHNASIGLLNELTVSNIQLLDATHKMGTDKEGKSLLDTLKSIGTVLKNAWPLLAGALIPFLRNITDAVTGVAGKLAEKMKGWFKNTPDVDTPDVDKPNTPKIPTKALVSEGSDVVEDAALLAAGKGSGKVPWYKRLNPFKRGAAAGAASEGATVARTGKIMSALGKGGKLLKRVPVLGTVLSIGALGYGAMKLKNAQGADEKNAAKRGLWGTLGGIGGGMAAGAGLGALVGTLGGGPIGTAIGGVVGGIGGAFLGEEGVKRLYDKKDDIAKWSKDKYNKVKNFTTDTAQAFWHSAPVETVRNLTTGFVTMISEVAKGVYDASVSILKALGGLTSRLWKQLGTWVAKKWDEWIINPIKSAGEWISKKWTELKDWTAKKWDSWVVEPVKAFGDWISGAWAKTKEVVSDKWNDWIVDPLKNFGHAVAEKWGDVKDWFGKVWEEYVPEPIKQMITFMKDKFIAVGDWLGDKWESWIVNPIHRALGAVREGFNAAGDWVGEKWNDWIIDPLKSFGTGLKNLWNKTTSWVGGMWDSIFGDRGEKAKENMIDAGKSGGDDARKVGSKVSNWLNSIAVSDEKGGGDPKFDDLSYAINGKIPGTDATSSDLSMIKSISDKFGINPNLWLALAETESHLYSKADNASSSARGWGQLLEGTAKGVYENTLKLGKYDHSMAFDKNTNATMSIAYLRQMFDTFNGDGTKAILAYNVGPGNVQKGIGVNDNGGYGAGHGSEYLQRVLQNLKENTGLNLSDVVDASKMSPVDYAMLGGTSGIGAGTDSSSSGLKEFTMATTLGSMGAFLGGDKIKEVYGFDPSQLTSSIDTELMKKADPFYAAVTGGGGAGAGYNAANMQYSDSDSEAVKARNSSLYSLISGDNDIHPFLAERLNNVSKAYGKSLSINSGFRSDAEQMQLIADWKAKHPGASEEERRKWVADPGRSNHGVGIAADISGWLQDLSANDLAKYGLYRPMSWEPWHFEPIETKLYGRSRDELMPLYGTPMKPNPNLSNYISTEFKSSGSSSYSNNTAGMNTPEWLNQTGGGDPKFDSFGPPDITQYTQRVQEASSANESSSSNLAKMVELLTVIANAVEKLVDISDESRQILKTYFENNIKAVTPNKRSNTSRPIVNNTGPAPSNPLGGGSSSKRGDKSALIAQIAKGSMM
jgi:hypothetical protein